MKALFIEIKRQFQLLGFLIFEKNWTIPHHFNKINWFKSNCFYKMDWFVFSKTAPFFGFGSV